MTLKALPCIIQPSAYSGRIREKPHAIGKLRIKECNIYYSVRRIYVVYLTTLTVAQAQRRMIR
jgi:hypothetical protein